MCHPSLLGLPPVERGRRRSGAFRRQSIEGLRQMSDLVNLAVIYYSATGTGTAIAAETGRAAEAAGAGVRVRKVAESAPRAAIESNPAWAAHHAATVDIPAPTHEDLVWADAGAARRAGRGGAQAVGRRRLTSWRC